MSGTAGLCIGIGIALAGHFIGQAITRLAIALMALAARNGDKSHELHAKQ